MGCRAPGEYVATNAEGWPNRALTVSRVAPTLSSADHASDDDAEGVER
jgi:hypothetical protein